LPSFLSHGHIRSFDPPFTNRFVLFSALPYCPLSQSSFPTFSSTPFPPEDSPIRWHGLSHRRDSAYSEFFSTFARPNKFIFLQRVPPCPYGVPQFFFSLDRTYFVCSNLQAVRELTGFPRSTPYPPPPRCYFFLLLFPTFGDPPPLSVDPILLVVFPSRIFSFLFLWAGCDVLLFLIRCPFSLFYNSFLPRHIVFFCGALTPQIER